MVEMPEKPVDNIPVRSKDDILALAVHFSNTASVAKEAMRRLSKSCQSHIAYLDSEQKFQKLEQRIEACRKVAHALAWAAGMDAPELDAHVSRIKRVADAAAEGGAL